MKSWRLITTDDGTQPRPSVERIDGFFAGDRRIIERRVTGSAAPTIVAARLSIKQRVGSTVVLLSKSITTAQTGAGQIVVDASGVVVRFVLSGNDTPLLLRRCVWDVDVRLADGSAYTLRQGTIQALRSVTSFDPVPPGIASVTVAPVTSTAIDGSNVQFSAVVRNSDGDLLATAPVWTSDDPSTVSINASSGLAHYIRPGATTIRATVGVVVGSAPVTVLLDTIVATVTTNLNPTTVAIGGTRQMSAVPRNAAGNVVPSVAIVYSSLTPATATVDPATGLVTGVAAGAVTIRATASGVNGDAVLTVLGVMDYLAMDFNADDPSGVSNLIVSYDPKLGSTPPTLASGGTVITALPPAYKKPGIATPLILKNFPTGDTNFGVLGYDNVLKEINSLGGNQGDLVSELDLAFSFDTPFTYWVITSTKRPTGTASDPLIRLYDRPDNAFSPITEQSQIFYRGGTADSYASGQMFGTNGQEVYALPYVPATNDDTVRLIYFGADPIAKVGWYGAMGDVWAENTPNAGLTMVVRAIRLHLTYNRPNITRSFFFSRGRPTAAQVRRLQAFAGGSRSSLRITLKRLRLFGNSLIAGTGASDYDHSFAGKMLANQATPSSTFSSGHPGATWAQLNAFAATELDYSFNPDRAFEDIYFYEYTNSNTGDAAHDYATMLTWLNARKAAAGATVRKWWTPTMLPFSGTTQAYLDAMWALQKAGRDAGLFLLNDLSGLAISQQANLAANFINEGGNYVHPNDATYLAWYNKAVADGVPI